MKCTCTVFVGYGGEGCEFHSEKIRIARKVHKCGECGREIQPGEEYESATGKWDGEFSSYKTCADCLSARNQFFNDGWWYGSVWEDLREYFHGCQGEIPERCIAALTPAARERACQILEDVWERLEDA